MKITQKKHYHLMSVRNVHIITVNDVETAIRGTSNQRNWKNCLQQKQKNSTAQLPTPTQNPPYQSIGCHDLRAVSNIIIIIVYLPMSERNRDVFVLQPSARLSLQNLEGFSCCVLSKQTNILYNVLTFK